MKLSYNDFKLLAAKFSTIDAVNSSYGEKTKQLNLVNSYDSDTESSHHELEEFMITIFPDMTLKDFMKIRELENKTVRTYQSDPYSESSTTTEYCNLRDVYDTLVEIGLIKKSRKNMIEQKEGDYTYANFMKCLNDLVELYPDNFKIEDGNFNIKFDGYNEKIGSRFFQNVIADTFGDNGFKIKSGPFSMGGMKGFFTKSYFGDDNSIFSRNQNETYGNSDIKIDIDVLYFGLLNAEKKLMPSLIQSGKKPELELTTLGM